MYLHAFSNFLLFTGMLNADKLDQIVIMTIWVYIYTEQPELRTDLKQRY